MSCILKIIDLSKKFSEVKVLNNVNFSLNKGEIHGIVGANGSGKSTLMNILFGSKYIAETGGYKGKIFIENKLVNIKNTYDAINNGIGMVHQELSLIDALDVSSNIKMKRENIISKTKFFRDFAIVDEKQNYKDTAKALSKIGIEIDPATKVKDLSINLRQFVEIAREIDNTKLKILILDEPTSSLNIEEVQVLISHLKYMAKNGVSIIFISHRLEEVVDICDRVTVLRDGEVINVYDKEQFDINKIALDMIGKEVTQILKNKRKLSNDDILSFKNVKVTVNDKIVKDISLTIKKGEILGITGLAGHGQDIFGYGLVGLYPMEGLIEYKGNKITDGKLKSIIKQGIYILPGDRKEMGLLINNSVWENIIFETYDKQSKFLKYPILNKFSPLNYRYIHKHVNGIVEKLNIKIRDNNQVVKELSGGNQQKVCIGRIITMEPEVLFIEEPTRGIDIYSKEVILEMLIKLNKENNTTIVISSSEVSELKRVCDRIVIMYENKIFDIFDSDFNGEDFRLAISGRRLNKYGK